MYLSFTSTDYLPAQFTFSLKSQPLLFSNSFPLSVYIFQTSPALSYRHIFIMAFVKLSALLFSALLAPNVQGTPVAHSPEDLAARGLSTCEVVKDVVNVLHNPALSASATKFCSSFISIPLKTSTSASTATVTPVPVTITTTVIVPTYVESGLRRDASLRS